MSWIDDVADEREQVVSWMQREREEGRQEERRNSLSMMQTFIRRAVLHRFGPLSPEHELALAEASSERLAHWVELLFTVPTAEALFEAPPDKRDA
ncbi:hypothetical protein L6R49_04825 [Myxococcota bacterium]|nr:hypothetical protein [Myxococcota bacterium]